MNNIKSPLELRHKRKRRYGEMKSCATLRKMGLMNDTNRNTETVKPNNCRDNQQRHDVNK